MLPLLLALLAAPVPAPEAAPESPDITVTSTRLTDAQINTAASAYVRAVLPVPAYGQYARWADPVCAKVSGITDAAAARVLARINAAADAAAIRRGKPGCRPNMIVVFTEAAATTVAAIVRKKPSQISRLSGADRQRLLTDPLPVRFWHGLELRGSDGRAAAPNASAALMSAQSGGGVPLGGILPGNAAQTDSWSSSLIDTHVAVWATSAVIVVDVTLADGKPLDAVADYVAMVGLAPMKLPPPAPGVPSILALFAAENPAPRLTTWDTAFLTSLYRVQMNRSGEQQRGQMIAGLKTRIKAAGEP